MCQNFILMPIKFGASDKVVIDLEIYSFLRKGIIEEVHTVEYGQFYSNIFYRPKKDGTVRIILNLKTFYDFVTKHHFKMETLQTAIANIHLGDYFAFIDLKDGSGDHF